MTACGTATIRQRFTAFAPQSRFHARTNRPRARAWGKKMTTILERVRALIERLAPEPVCDACIAGRLELEATSHPTQELAGTTGFVREIAPCALCGETRKAIRAGSR
jgi:hypothetical protein